MILALFAVSTASTISVPEVAYGQIANDREEALVMRHTASLEKTESIVRAYFSDIPIMAEVARCESTFRHRLADGTVLHGRVDPADTGVMQINKRYHQKTADALEIDLDTIEGNMEFARYLYDGQGTQPWSASMPCWGKTLAVNY